MLYLNKKAFNHIITTSKTQTELQGIQKKLSKLEEDFEEAETKLEATSKRLDEASHSLDENERLEFEEVLY